MWEPYLAYLLFNRKNYPKNRLLLGLPYSITQAETRQSSKYTSLNLTLACFLRGLGLTNSFETFAGKDLDQFLDP
jgi:hypothetical protein